MNKFKLLVEKVKTLSILTEVESCLCPQVADNQ